MTLKAQLSERLKKTDNRSFRLSAHARANQGKGHYQGFVTKAVSTPVKSLNKYRDVEVFFASVIPTARHLFKSFGDVMKSQGADPNLDFTKMLKSLLDQGMTREQICAEIGMSLYDLASFGF